MDNYLWFILPELFIKRKLSRLFTCSLLYEGWTMGNQTSEAFRDGKEECSLMMARAWCFSSCHLWASCSVSIPHWTNRAERWKGHIHLLVTVWKSENKAVCRGSLSSDTTVIFVLCSISDFSEPLHCLCIGWVGFIDHLPFRMMTFWFSWFPMPVEKVNCDKKGEAGLLQGESL